LVVEVRTQGTVVNRAADSGVGVDVEGRKHVLGVWLGDGGEGAKFWSNVLTEIRNRGVEDVLVVCCDGAQRPPGRDRGHLASGSQDHQDPRALPDR
jgi:putative transposase